jgi:hypothetical protein
VEIVMAVFLLIGCDHEDGLIVQLAKHVRD